MLGNDISSRLPHSPTPPVSCMSQLPAMQANLRAAMNSVAVFSINKVSFSKRYNLLGFGGLAPSFYFQNDEVWSTTLSLALHLTYSEPSLSPEKSAVMLISTCDISVLRPNLCACSLIFKFLLIVISNIWSSRSLYSRTPFCSQEQINTRAVH